MTSILSPSRDPVSTRARNSHARSSRLAIVAVTFAVFLLFWHLYATQSDSVFDMPTPWSTADAAADMWSSGELRTAAIESGQVLLLGTIPAVVLGVLIGVLIGGVRELDVAFSPYIFAFYTTPFVALIPIYLLIFGLDVVGKAAIVFSLVWVAVVIQTTAGVRDVDPRFLEVARSFRASWWRQLLEIRLPAASSLIVAGMRLAIGRALVGVVVCRVRHRLQRAGSAHLPVCAALRAGLRPCPCRRPRRCRCGSRQRLASCRAAPRAMEAS